MQPLRFRSVHLCVRGSGGHDTQTWSAVSAVAGQRAEESVGRARAMCVWRPVRRGRALGDSGRGRKAWAGACRTQLHPVCRPRWRGGGWGGAGRVDSSVGADQWGGDLARVRALASIVSAVESTRPFGAEVI